MKETADTYYIRADSFAWARVFILEGERAPRQRWGYLSIISDFGNFGYRWTHIDARPFREFLASLEFGYAMEKLRPEDWKRFNLDESLKRVKREVMRRRRDSSIDHDTARRLYDEVIDVAAEGLMSCEHWGNELMEALGVYWTAGTSGNGAARRRRRLIA